MRTANALLVAVVIALVGAAAFMTYKVVNTAFAAVNSALESVR